MQISNKLSRRRVLQAPLLALTIPDTVFAQGDWPAKPVRIIVPSSAGGGTDAFGRILAQALTEHTKQNFVVDNKPGASGNIGAEMAARAEPDGYTILVASNSSLAINPVLLKNMPFDIDKDLAAVSRGESEDASILRDMLVGGRMIEGGGCGFNPKAPRHTAYPAGSNAPGALHFGIDLAKPADYIRRVMPDWEEPPIHVDLVSLDATVRAGDNLLIEEGFLCALRDPEVVKAAARFGDPVELLEAGVE